MSVLPFVTRPPARDLPGDDLVAVAALDVADQLAEAERWEPVSALIRAEPGRPLLPASHLVRLDDEQRAYNRSHLDAAEAHLLAVLSCRPGLAVVVGGKTYGRGKAFRAGWVAVLVPV